MSRILQDMADPGKTEMSISNSFHGGAPPYPDESAAGLEARGVTKLNT